MLVASSLVKKQYRSVLCASAVVERTTSAHSILGVRVKASGLDFRAQRIAKILSWFHYLLVTPYLDVQRENPKEQVTLWIDRLVTLISLSERPNWIMLWAMIRQWRNAQRDLYWVAILLSLLEHFLPASFYGLLTVSEENLDSNLPHIWMIFVIVDPAADRVVQGLLYSSDQKLIKYFVYLPVLKQVLRN